MNTSRKWLWTAMFSSVALLVSVAAVSGYIFSHKGLDWLSMTHQKLDAYTQKISSATDIANLKETYISHLELEKEQAEIMRDYMDVIFQLSAILVVLTCPCLMSWFLYARAVQKEVKCQ